MVVVPTMRYCPLLLLLVCGSFHERTPLFHCRALQEGKTPARHSHERPIVRTVVVIDVVVHDRQKGVDGNDDDGGGVGKE